LDARGHVADLASKYGAQFLNLETAVPPGLWGMYHKDDVDFMHFQGDGHRLLAQAIAPALRKAIGEF
jgi:lysophospholipase L1-like esterase